MAKGSSALHNAIRASTGRTSLIPSEEGAGYSVDISFGGKTFEVILDTGSSDLWLAEAGVKCVDETMTRVPTAECGFGPLASATFQAGQIASENFNISYGDGESLTGVLGYESVGLANITVDKQEVALVREAYWKGDNVTSGLMGFAFPSLTSAFSGTDPSVDNENTTAVPYTNWIFNAIDKGLINPMFSLAIERGSKGGGGQLALGGLPDIDFNHTFTSTPLKIIELTPHAIEAKNYSYYTIVPDGFLLSGEEDTYYGYQEFSEHPSTTYPVIVDSGTTLVYLPERIADIVNALFDPPSVYIEEEGVYENYCDATPPTFAIRINGTDFYISSADLLLTGELGLDTETGGCVTGVQPMDGGIYILGDVFLKNVVAVFDIGASEMRFAPHEKY
ncbi:hypothetical protein LTR36_003860 [Oleoguttula mirabilis]|uniref:Peptidase A1 domain-containing protein n=1 Tax=Oleoguttula mirabilis TaxID=1507867 RepID=A0AAV9JKA4_9PEZI|nr:hypothetical protein LTR36_003860 [Oleoguttula mirabilis]